MSITRLKELTKQTETDQIREYFAMPPEEQEKYILSNTIERKLVMIEMVKHHIAMDDMKSKILEILMHHFEISMRHAANIYDLTVILFDPVEIKMEMLLRDIRKTQILAEAKQDSKGKAAAEKNKLVALRMYSELTQKQSISTVSPIILLGFFPELVMQEDVTEEELMAFVEKERNSRKQVLLAEETEVEDIPDDTDDHLDRI